MPKLDSPSGLAPPKSPEKVAYESFIRDYPLVDIDHPAHEGNGLWVAKWYSIRRTKRRLALKREHWKLFFDTLRAEMEVDFPAQLGRERGQKKTPRP